MMGTTEWLVVLAVVLLVFGASKLPQLGDGLGRAIKNFKRAVTSANEIEVSAKKPTKLDPAEEARRQLEELKKARDTRSEMPLGEPTERKRTL